MNHDMQYVKKLREDWMKHFGWTEDQMNDLREGMVSAYVQATVTARLARSSECREPV